MAARTPESLVLLPIKPRFAKLIVAGSKMVEFRKKGFQRTVSTIVIYSSSPDKKVVGIAQIEAIEHASPSEIWDKYHSVGGINAVDYNAYFLGSETAYAIRLKSVRKMATPVPLSRLKRQLKAPQSFMYLDDTVLSRLELED